MRIEPSFRLQGCIQAHARYRGFLAGALGLFVGVGASTAMAQELTVRASGDPFVASFFTLDFGELGGIASGHIVLTDIELEINVTNASARFSRYYQEVEPLILPGGFSTGDIVIEVLEGSSHGSYDQRTGRFDTQEEYLIHFAGDLSPFGLESPVILPSASTGFVTFDSGAEGHVNLDWAGNGELQNPFPPGGTIEFEYTCTVNTTFAPEPTNLLRLGLVPEVFNLGTNPGIERGLVTRLINSAARLDADQLRSAVRQLDAFILTVDALAGRRIDAASADSLINLTDDAIALILDSASTSKASLHGWKGRGR